MSIIKLQQAVADTVLQRLLTIDPFAIIAGGAPRDWYLGREATDLDVYFYAGGRSTETIYDLLIDVGFKLDGYKDFGEAGIGYGKSPETKVIFEPLDTPIPVQLIMMGQKTHDSVLSSFAVNLSLTWYKHQKITTTPEFDAGVKNKSIVRVHPNYQDDDPYIEKIRAKFPDYAYFSCDDGYFKAHPEQIDNWTYSMKRASLDADTVDLVDNIPW